MLDPQRNACAIQTHLQMLSLDWIFLLPLEHSKNLHDPDSFPLSDLGSLSNSNSHINLMENIEPIPSKIRTTYWESLFDDFRGYVLHSGQLAPTLVTISRHCWFE